MNILYIAYSCAPNKGSEEKIGWNIPLESSKTNNVYVITKEEHRAVITEYIKENNIKNIEFYFVDIPKIYKKISKTIYTFRLNKLHKNAFKLAKELCKEKKIDIIHQITPIEIRSIGNYGKIKDVKFVCGPLGGGEYIPRGLRSYATRFAFFEWLRKGMNCFYRTKSLISRKMSRCDYVFFANQETARYFNKLTKANSAEVYFDNGISIEDFSVGKKSCDEERETHIIVAGRLAYKKGHMLLLDALKKLPKSLKYQVRIVGEGPEKARLRKKCALYGLEDRVTFLGRIPFSQMQEEYNNADVFVMPSIRETTGAVLLESAANAVPVIAINKFGGPVLFDETSAWLYNGKSKKEYIDNLANALIECIENPNMRIKKGENARNIAFAHTWDRKLEKYNCIYEKIKRDI